ncbi:Nucleolar protein 9 [Vanrija pseudolonga]|uniref:Nucleolar protein 9 n=1 Tax=Vanrija pseudolonga TaxID=143232 RepID=A0AAF0YJP4_9TREE|nr:Nucleolar protein 9 [Vanrija pseudolonga]
MPKEQIRKRGKRKTKQEDEFVPKAAAPAVPEPVAANDDAAASGGIHPSRLAFMKTGVRPPPPPKPEGGEGDAQEGVQEDGAADWTRGPRHESEFPFGPLDPDVKAYFRNVEEQVKDWEGAGVGEENAGEEREDRQLFLTSVLNELRGHELQVATDPETAVVLERLLPSLNDWGRRVVGDSVGEGWETLVRHRFGSHVAQTWLTLAAGTLDREVGRAGDECKCAELTCQARGIYPPQHAEQRAKAEGTDEGTLPTMAELVTTLTDALLPVLPVILISQFASPVVRLLLLVLTPNRALPSLDGADSGANLIRSKRSGKFRKGQGVQGKSILGDEQQPKGKGKEREGRDVPAAVAALRGKIRAEVMARVSGVEWQSMGVDKVGSAAVQLLLEVEVADSDAEKEGSLLDIITEGLVAHLHADPDADLPEAKPFLSALQVSSTGTRLFEALLRLSPEPVFQALWFTYFDGKIGKLAQHPYANFAVGVGVSRLNAGAAKAAVGEVQAVSGGRGLIKTARTSVLLALVERATALGDADVATAVVGLIKSALDLGDHADALVPALMALKTYPIYEAIRTGAEVPDDEEVPADAVDKDAEAQATATARRSAWENRRNTRPRGQLEPNMQGCLLLQALVALPTGNIPVLDSLFAQPTDTLLAYAKSPIASHLLDKVLTSPAVPAKYRRKLYLGFVGRYAELADDRLGSRVADTVWDTADGYMREKIARSLIPDATTLANSQFGRFLSRRLDLHLLQRRPDEWRAAQIGVKHHFAHQKEAEAKPVPAPAPVAAEVKAEPSAEDEAAARKAEKRKWRKEREEKDEIDELFASSEKSKKKKSKRV